MSANRGNSLAKIEYMMEEQFAVAASDKRMLYQLMYKDSFLYPTADRVSTVPMISYLGTFVLTNGVHRHQATTFA